MAGVANDRASAEERATTLLRHGTWMPPLPVVALGTREREEHENR
jgi:hypothetical protein